LPLLAASGCFEASYVTQQAFGQLRLLRGRQHIERVLRRDNLPAGWRRKLELVLIAREYGFRHIGLTRTAGYTRFYDTGGKPIAYNLSAAPKDALRPRVWRFPIVGRVPYLGFFKRADGVVQKRKLERQGFDTYLRPVSAYSSLGWFIDPVYSTMLDRSEDRIVELVLHESTHTTIFLRGEVGFNESLAVFVGQQGTLNLFARLFGPKSQQVARARARFRRSRRFGRLVEKLYRDLEALYASELPRTAKLARRQHLFLAAQARYRVLFPKSRRAFVRKPLNNAIVLSYGRYLRGVRFHREVYRCLGRNLEALVALYKTAQHFKSPVEYAARRCKLRPPPQRM
jgi:predicted aminopeptidase